MCSSCKNVDQPLKVYQIDSAIQDIRTILIRANSSQESLTLLKLLSIWTQTCVKNKIIPGVKKLQLSPELAEFFIGVLYYNKVIKISKGFNNYSTICYIETGSVLGPLSVTTRRNLVGFPEIENSEPVNKKRKTENAGIVVIDD